MSRLMVRFLLRDCRLGQCSVWKGLPFCFFRERLLPWLRRPQCAFCPWLLWRRPAAGKWWPATAWTRHAEFGKKVSSIHRLARYCFQASYLKEDDKEELVGQGAADQLRIPSGSEGHYKRVGCDTSHVKESGDVEPRADVLGFVAYRAPVEPKQTLSVGSKVKYVYQ